MDWLIEPFNARFMQRALLEVALLAVAGGLLGTWVVLRRLAFFTHAAGTAAFPGLVVAGPWGLPPQLAALGAGLLYAAGVVRLTGARRIAADAATGLLLVAMLALGVVLASDVYASSAGVDRLLFGTLIGLSDGDLALSAGVAALALLATAALGRAWLATGFDPGGARSLGLAPTRADWLLLAVLAAAVVATLPAVGALLVSALLVVPAATARVLARSVRSMQALAVVLAVGEGAAGLLLAWYLDLPPGPAIALLGGAVFALAAAARALGTRRTAALAVVALLPLIATGCGSGGSGAPEPSLRAVATTTHVGDFVRAVGGGRVQVTTLLRPNTDPHDYEPRPGDLAAAQDADLVFRSGGDLDAWLADLPGAVGSDVPVVDLSKSVTLRERRGAADPHWWQDPRNVESAVTKIRDELIKADPDGSVPYRRNARRYLRRVRALDRALARCFRRIPARSRRLVTSHDALGYFAARYGLEVAGAAIPALSTRAQPSAGEIARLVRRIREEDVRAIFAERGVNESLERSIARETGARVVASLFTDSLGPPGSGGETYLAAQASNGRAIAAGLSGGTVRCEAAG